MSYQTPAQLKGYKVGDKFTVNDNCTFRKGSIVTLFSDDRSDCPLFSGSSDDTGYRCCDGQPGAYLNLSNITPVENPKPVEFKVGDTVKIARINGGFERYYLNMVGKIEYIDHSHLPVKVSFPDDDFDWGRFDELELVVPQSAPIDTTSVRQKLEAIEKLTREIKELLG
jgi:hypothetical protein